MFSDIENCIAGPTSEDYERGRGAAWGGPKKPLKHTSVPQDLRDASLLKNSTDARRHETTGLLRRSRLVFHVHDLHPAVGFRHRLVRVLQLALAIADGDEVGGRDVVVVDQILLDRVGALFRELLIIGLAAGGVGVAGHDEGG